MAIDLFTVLTYRGASVLPRSAVINAGPEIESSLCFAAELLPTSQCAKNEENIAPLYLGVCQTVKIRLKLKLVLKAEAKIHNLLN